MQYTIHSSGSPGAKSRSLLRATLLMAATLPLLAIEPPEAAARKIQAETLLANTRILASDEFEGRAPSSAGEEKTITFLVETLRSMGLQPGGTDGRWTQEVPIVGVTSEVSAELVHDSESTTLQFPQDFVGWSPRLDTEVSVARSELVFVGYGIHAPEYDWDDFKDVDVRGKTVVILINDPPVPDPNDPTQLDPDQFKGKAMTYYGRWTYKYEEAARRGAAAALIIHETIPAAYPWFVVINSWGREQFRLASDKDPTVAIAGWISLAQAERLFEANGTSYEAQKQAALDRSFRPLTLRQKATFNARQTVREVRSRNVLAMVPGRDPALRDEWIVYTAHWDHLGRDERLEGDQIFNGALDNAIGTAGLLELARAFQSAEPSPRRSILFVALTAEEQGLLGARHYTSEPIYPLDKTLANINMDGLNPWGRTRDIQLVGAGTSSLEATTKQFVERRGRILLPDPNPERGTFFRSDHFEFVRKGIPALYLKSGGQFIDHPPEYGEAKVRDFINNDYHKVSDEVKDDWELSGAVEDLRLLFEVGWQVAEEDDWPTWHPDSEFQRLPAGKSPDL